MAARDPSVAELLKTLGGQTGELVRQELALARTEMTGKARVAAGSTGMIIAGGALVHAALLALVAALVIGLSTVMPEWVSALTAGIALAVVGSVTGWIGWKKLERLNAVPEQTVASLTSLAKSVRPRDELRHEEGSLR